MESILNSVMTLQDRVHTPEETPAPSLAEPVAIAFFISTTSSSLSLESLGGMAVYLVVVEGKGRMLRLRQLEPDTGSGGVGEAAIVHGTRN